MFNFIGEPNVFFEFSKVADIGIGGFKNMDKKELKFLDATIIIKRRTNIISDTLYFFRENHYDGREKRKPLSFFDNTDVFVPDGEDSNVITKMKLSLVDLISFKQGFFTYNLSQRIEVNVPGRKYVYKVKNIRFITNSREAYLIYPNGMGRVYRE